MPQPAANPSRQIVADFVNFGKAAQFLNAALSGLYRVIIYGGAIRGGKTFNSVAILILLHRKYPGSRSAITRDTWKTMKRNVYPTCRKAIPENFISKFNQSDYYWTFTNQSEMFFFPENWENDKELRSWDGLEVNFILLEQAEGLHHICMEKALERVGSYMIPTGTQPPPLLLITMNPNSTWARTFYEQYRKKELPKNWLYIPALIDDNPHIDQSYKDSLLELKTTNPIKYKRYVEGDWDVEDDADDRLLSNQEIENTFTNSFVPQGKRVISSDIAFEGSDRFVIGHWSGWRLERITIIPKSNGSQVIEELKHAAHLFKVANSDIAFDSDGVGAGIGGFIPGAKEFKSRKPPLLDDGYETIKDEAAWLLAKRIGQNEVYFSPDCQPYAEAIRQELRVLRRKKESGYNAKLALIRKDDMKAYLSGKSPDILDMMIIRAWVELTEGKQSVYYSLFNPDVHTASAGIVKYVPQRPLHIGIALNNHFHVNAVVVQTDPQTGVHTCIKQFVLSSPDNTIQALCNEITTWAATLPDFSTYLPAGCAYYARPLGNTEADEDFYAQCMQEIATYLKPLKPKHKGLMIPKKGRLVKPLTDRLLSGNKLLISIEDCPDLIADFQKVRETKTGDKEDTGTNTGNLTDALENYLSIINPKN